MIYSIYLWFCCLAPVENQKQTGSSQNLYIGVGVGGLAVVIIAIIGVAVCLVKRKGTL